MEALLLILDFILLQALENLRKIVDGSLDDIYFPDGDFPQIKQEPLIEYDDPMSGNYYDANDDAIETHTGDSNINVKTEVIDESQIKIENGILKRPLKPKKRKSFACTECGLTFTRRKLREHAYAIHNKERRKHMCSFCDEEFENITYLKKHMDKKHPGETPEFKCTYCLKVFKFRSLLKIHVEQVHEKKKPFQCDKCDYRLV